MVFGVLGKLKNLQKLKIAGIETSNSNMIQILNESLGRQSQIVDLEVLFESKSDVEGSSTAIKFPKYLKKLKSLKLTNIWHKEFTETLFDLASQRRL